MKPLILLSVCTLLVGVAPALAQAPTPSDAPLSPDAQATPGEVDPLDRPADLHPPGTQAASNFGYSLSAGVASDYIFRGVDQTHGGVEGFAGVDLSWRQLYAGAWTSNVNFSAVGNHRVHDETDVYAGWRPNLAGFDLDLGTIYYGYPGAAGDLGYVEGYAKVSRTIGPLSGQAAVYASPDYPAGGDGGYYTEGRLAYTLTSSLTLSAAIGRKDAESGRQAMSCGRCESPDGGFTYTTWNAGLAWVLANHLTLDLRYSDTDARRYGSAFGDRVVVSARAAFP